MALYTIRITEQMRSIIVRALEADAMVNPNCWDDGTDTGGISPHAPANMLWNAFAQLPAATPGIYGNESFLVHSTRDNVPVRVDAPVKRTEVVILSESTHASALADLFTISAWTGAALVAKWCDLGLLFTAAVGGVTFAIGVWFAHKSGRRHRYTIEQARSRIDEIERRQMSKQHEQR